MVLRATDIAQFLFGRSLELFDAKSVGFRQQHGNILA